MWGQELKGVMPWLLCPSGWQEVLGLRHTLGFHCCGGSGKQLLDMAVLLSALRTAAIHLQVCEFKINLIHLNVSFTFPCSAVKRCSLSYSLALQDISFFYSHQFGSYVLCNTNMADPKRVICVRDPGSAQHK